jgi:hypothetical protein
MKLFCLLMASLPMLIFSQFSIGLPECNVLYSGYDNMVTLGIDGCDQSALSCAGGTIRKDTINGLYCYIVNPSPGARQVKLTATGKSKGKSLTYASMNFQVKPLPGPSLSTYTISKSLGDTLRLELNDTYIQKEYIILSCRVMEQSVVGNVITPAMLSAFEVGQYISVNLVAMDVKSRKQFTLTAALKITE